MQDLRISQNFYDIIKSFNLGNLSALNRIPEFYIKHLIQYIVNISASLAQAHNHDLIHGDFNLSKVIAQKIKIEEKVVN